MMNMIDDWLIDWLMIEYDDNINMTLKIIRQFLAIEKIKHYESDDDNHTVTVWIPFRIILTSAISLITQARKPINLITASFF